MLRASVISTQNRIGIGIFHIHLTYRHTHNVVQSIAKRIAAV